MFPTHPDRRAKMRPASLPISRAACWMYSPYSSTRSSHLVRSVVSKTVYILNKGSTHRKVGHEHTKTADMRKSDDCLKKGRQTHGSMRLTERRCCPSSEVIRLMGIQGRECSGGRKQCSLLRLKGVGLYRILVQRSGLTCGWLVTSPPLACRSYG